MSEARIAAAAGSATGTLRKGTPVAKLVEAAMVEATEAAAADGVSDPDEILARKLAARDAVKAGLAATEQPPLD